MSNGQITDEVLSALKGVAPILGNALLPGAGGPIAAAAMSFLSSKLSVPVDKVQETLAGMTPDQIVQMHGLDIDFQKFCLDNGIKLDEDQIALNTEETKVAQGTDKWWVQLWIAGWRPFVGWICGTAVGYEFLIRPVFNGIAALFGAAHAPFPTLEIQDLFALLTTLLGHSAMRSYDKAKGVSSGE